MKTKNLTPTDLYPPHEEMKSKYCGAMFAKAWNKSRWDFMKKGKDEIPSVMPTIFKAFIGKTKGYVAMLPFYYLASIVAPITI